MKSTCPYEALETFHPFKALYTKLMSKAQDVGGVSFQGLPIMIGAGVCKEPELTREWLKVAPVVSGSYTKEARRGNSGDRLFYPDTLEEFLKLGYGLNLFGLKNDGIIIPLGWTEDADHLRIGMKAVLS